MVHMITLPGSLTLPVIPLPFNALHFKYAGLSAVPSLARLISHSGLLFVPGIFFPRIFSFLPHITTVSPPQRSSLTTLFKIATFSLSNYSLTPYSVSFFFISLNTTRNYIVYLYVFGLYLPLESPWGPGLCLVYTDFVVSPDPGTQTNTFRH